MKAKVKAKPTPMPMPLIRSLVETYYDFQDQRIITSNRINMNSERNGITEAQLKQYGISTLLNKAESFEEDIKKLLDAEIVNHEIYTKYLSGIQGIGTIISSALVAYIGDISKFDNISKLWQEAGLGMNYYCEQCKEPTYKIKTYTDKTGKKKNAKQLSPQTVCQECGCKTVPVIQRRTMGYMSNWNDKFKVLLWKVGQSFVKQSAKKSGYRRLYDSIKAEERRKHPQKIKANGKTKYNDGHINNMTLRKVEKIFLANLWMKWREMDGLTVGVPYVNLDPHHNLIKPFLDRVTKKP